MDQQPSPVLVDSYRGKRRYILEVRADEVVVVAVGEGVGLRIHLDGNCMEEAPLKELPAAEPLQRRNILGIVGKLELFTSFFLVVVTACTRVAVIDGHSVWRIDEIDIVQLGPSDFLSNENNLSGQPSPHMRRSPSSGSFNSIPQQTARPATLDAYEDLENTFMNEMKSMFQEGAFYFCDTTDITHATFRVPPHAPQDTRPLWPQADERFFYNRHLLEDFILAELHRWAVPVMQGFIQQTRLPLEGEPVEMLLISRRSCMRSGFRFKRRGIDSSGNVANFVESEQIIHCHGHTMSHIQIRGSVPVYWHQNGQSYRPPPQLSSRHGPEEVSSAFDIHMATNRSIYGRQLVVNLLGKGPEQVLTTAYLAQINRHRSQNNLSQLNPLDDPPATSKPTLRVFENLRRNLSDNKLANSSTESLGSDTTQPIVPDSLSELMKQQSPSEDLTYVPFDFNLLCKGSNYGPLQGLMHEVKPYIEAHGWLWLDPQKEILRTQSGVVRTNCMDCLDRTNVVQMQVAKYCLHRQLQSLGLLLDPEMQLGESVLSVFHNVWANNGDAISMQYAGTQALKRDFTRTGKRGVQGMVFDGYNSITRYYLNHFKHDTWQTMIDLLHGTITLYDVETPVPGPEEPQPTEWVHPTEDEWNSMRAETYKTLVEDCEGRLDSGEINLAFWDLVYMAGSGKESECLLMLSVKALYVFLCDFQKEPVRIRVPVNTLQSITLGPIEYRNVSGDVIAAVNPPQGLKLTHTCLANVPSEPSLLSWFKSKPTNQSASSGQLLFRAPVFDQKDNGEGKLVPVVSRLSELLASMDIVLPVIQETIVRQETIATLTTALSNKLTELVQPSSPARLRVPSGGRSPTGASTPINF